LASKIVSVTTTITVTVVAAVLSTIWLVNYTAIVQALRTPLERAMTRMYTDNPANETLQIASYPTIPQVVAGIVHFLGEVLNKGSEPASAVEIIATLYDLNNQVIGTRAAYTTPSTIPSGQSAPFELTVGFGDNVPIANIDHVKFHLDWMGSNHNAALNFDNSTTNNNGNPLTKIGTALKSMFRG
jgi:hypothetical protein